MLFLVFRFSELSEVVIAHENEIALITRVIVMMRYRLFVRIIKCMGAFLCNNDLFHNYIFSILNDNPITSLADGVFDGLSSLGLVFAP